THVSASVGIVEFGRLQTLHVLLNVLFGLSDHDLMFYHFRMPFHGLRDFFFCDFLLSVSTHEVSCEHLLLSFFHGLSFFYRYKMGYFLEHSTNSRSILMNYGLVNFFKSK